MSEQTIQSPADPLNVNNAMDQKIAVLMERISLLEEEMQSLISIPKEHPRGFLDGERIVGQITGAGADANHWLWQFVHIDHSDGSDVLGQQGDTIYGQCTVIGASDGQVGMQGIMVIQGRDDASTTVAMIPGSGGETIAFLITGNATGQCIYTAKTYTDPTTDIDGSNDLSASNFGTPASSNDALVLNMPELGFSVTGHDVTNANNTFSLYGKGRICHINADGTKVIEANMFYTTCKASS